jgi:hypothetical protein
MTASCQKTAAYNSDLFMPHQKALFDGFSDHQFPLNFHRVEETTTYLLPRDEDCENTFHSSSDTFNMFLVQQILQLDVNEQQILIFDKHQDYQYLELYEKAFAPVHNVHRFQEKYGSQKVMFTKLIFHLESPASLLFPETSLDWITTPTILSHPIKSPVQRCKDSFLFDTYRRYVLSSFHLLEVSPSEIPTITLVLRRRTPAVSSRSCCNDC